MGIDGYCLYGQCCQGSVCNEETKMCEAAPSEDNATCLAEKDPCANNTDGCCDGLWCNLWAMECQKMEEDNATCLAEKDPCANNTDGCCDGLWCNLWAMECQKMEEEVHAVAEQLIQ